MALGPGAWCETFVTFDTFDKGIVMARSLALKGTSGLLAIVVLSALAGPAAQAQNSRIQALGDRLDRLERDLVELQGGADGIAAAPAFAQQESRLGQLEEQLRQLTGQIEEAQHQLRQISERLAGQVGDAESRIADIERRLASGAAPVAGVAPQLIPPAGVVADTPLSGEAAPGETLVIGGDPNLERFDTMQVLGQIPAEPDPAAAGAAGAVGAVAAVDPVAPGPPADPEETYQAAYRLLRQADYAEAETALRLFIDNFPDHALAGNAYYWLGETYYVRDDYERAAKAFARGYKAFPDGAKAPDNLLKLGMALSGMNQTTQACTTFDKLRADHPDAPAAIRERLERERQKFGCP